MEICFWIPIVSRIFIIPGVIRVCYLRRNLVAVTSSILNIYVGERALAKGSWLDEARSSGAISGGYGQQQRNL